MECIDTEHLISKTLYIKTLKLCTLDGCKHDKHWKFGIALTLGTRKFQMPFSACLNL